MPLIFVTLGITCEIPSCIQSPNLVWNSLMYTANLLICYWATEFLPKVTRQVHGPPPPCICHTELSKHKSNVTVGTATRLKLLHRTFQEGYGRGKLCVPNSLSIWWAVKETLEQDTDAAGYIIYYFTVMEKRRVCVHSCPSGRDSVAH